MTPALVPVKGRHGTSATTTAAQNLDVIIVRQLLQLFVPYELACLILNEANYNYATITTKRTSHIILKAISDPLNNAKYCYMISLPVPASYSNSSGDPNEIVPTKVKSVKFTLNSSDQGWGGYAEVKNYRNSYTWFEASIFRPTTPSSSHTISSDLLLDLPNDTNDLLRQGYTEVQNLHKPSRRWLLQMNAQATRHARKHTVIWQDTSSCSNSKAQMFGEFDAMTGSGRGFGFVESLKAGDRIAIIARALYPGWENHIHSAEVELSYQA